MSRPWKLPFLLLMGLLAAIALALIKLNSQPLSLQLGLFDFPSCPAGIIVASALWTGILLSGVLGWLGHLGLRSRLRRAARHQQSLQEALRSARSLPLRLDHDSEDPGSRDGLDE